MFTKLVKLAAVMTLALTILPALANASGGGGGGSRPMTVKFTGYITAMVEAPEGLYVTVGTSYYNVGTALVTPDTKVTINQTNTTDYLLYIGDYATITATYPGYVATKLEIIR